MLERETIFPLMLGVLVAIAVHGVVLPLAARGLLPGGAADAPGGQPNLRIAGVEAPDRADAGTDVEIGFTVENRSDTATRLAWSDAVYISRDDRLSPDDVLLTSFERAEPLSPGGSYLVRRSVTIPARVDGDMFVIVRADAFDQVYEQEQEEDNTAARPIHIVTPPRPDLEIASVRGPRKVTGDEAFHIAYEVVNAGDRAANLQPQTQARAQGLPALGLAWRDRVYVSWDKRLDMADAALAEVEHVGALEGYAVKRSPVLVVPPPYAGEVYLIVKADADDSVEEHPHEDNNTAWLKIEVDRPRPAKDDVSRRSEQTSRRDRPKPKPPTDPQAEPKVRLGRDDAPDQLKMAWISHEQFEKLLAPLSKVEQPPLQKDVDPSPVERMPDDPTPPAVRSTQAAPQLARAATSEPAPRPTPARRVESKSPVDAPAPPVLQEPADAPQPAQTPPRRQAKADAAEAIPDADPIDQQAADAVQPSDGEPTKQEATSPPRAVNTDPSRPGPTPKPDTAVAAQTRDAASAEQSLDTTPTRQAQSRADEPEAAGEPTRQDEAKGPDREDGEPGRQLPAVTPEPDPDGRLASAERVDSPDSTEPDPTQKPDPQQDKPTPREDEATSRPAPSPREANPTAAPRSEQEAAPAALVDAEQVRPGKVLVGKGIEIRTISPRFSAISMLSAVPRNPIAKISFDGAGKVTEARLLRTTGYVDIDSPIIASLYAWSATGEELKKHPEGFSITMKILLGPED